MVACIIVYLYSVQVPYSEYTVINWIRWKAELRSEGSKIKGRVTRSDPGVWRERGKSLDYEWGDEVSEWRERVFKGLSAVVKHLRCVNEDFVLIDLNSGWRLHLKCVGEIN